MTSRTYQLYVPDGVGPSSRVPLLISLHGTGANGTIQNGLTGWSGFADAQAQGGTPFILALPDGEQSLWFWGTERSFDVQFVFSVIAEIVHAGCTDPAAIFVDGWSEGGYMAQRMACASGDPAVDPQAVVIAAVHSYAGGDPVVAPEAAGPAACGPRGHPLGHARVLLSQGLEDRVIDPDRMGFPAVQTWARRYGCDPTAGPLEVLQTFGHCQAGASVVWWPIQGFEHVTWSCPADRAWHNRGVWQFLARGAAPTSTTCP